MRGEDPLHVRVGRDDRSARIALPAEIIDRAADCPREFLFDTLSRGRRLWSTVSPDHDPDTAE
jgi:hypothetical protein